MLDKLKNNINEYWLFFIIITQPILDIIAYFSFNEKITVISFTIRSIYLAFIVLYTFLKIKPKKNYLLCLSPIAIFSFLHLLNSYRLFGFNIFNDIRYIILVMQMPVIAISLCFYIKQNREQTKKIEKGFVVSFIIIFISAMLALITGTGKTTYLEYGLNGWFSSPNTQSMILSVLCPYCLYHFSKQKNWIYFMGIIMIFIMLFFNGTKACYYTLISLLLVSTYICITNKYNRINLFKVVITILFFASSIFFYGFSFASTRQGDVEENSEESTKVIEEWDEDFTREETITILKSVGLYKQMINDFGEERVYQQMKGKINSYRITDNRYVKRTYAKFIFEDSDILTKIVGFNHGIIDNYGRDLENDLTAIFYYYGYLGFILYCSFLLYFIILGLRIFFRNPTIVLGSKFTILTYNILLGIYGSEYSGALLRKSNANIYFALVLVLYFAYITKRLSKKKIEKNKISFLLLHLGFGGIETSSINTINSLVDKYDIEVISFYNLTNNQADKLDDRVSVRYLCKYQPNRELFKKYVKNHNYIKAFYQGIIALLILAQKRVLVINAIVECNSKYIVSTRYTFSRLLSKYGTKDNIKIAQEHHYHNNDKKYINIISKKYKKIDYLFALTKTLENDYKKFLFDNNKHTQVVLVPNMINYIPDKCSKLDKKNIITVSRLDYGKKNDDIIQAFSKIKDKKWNLYIIGDGNEYNNLSDLIKKLNLTDRVTLTGYKNREEIEKYMLESSLFLMASLTEGLPMVLLEAMSYGIPCIAYETASGVSDIINDNENGYIIKNRNEKEYIEKIDKIINDEELRKKMGENAQKTVNKFSKEEILKIWYKVLK